VEGSTEGEFLEVAWLKANTGVLAGAWEGLSSLGTGDDDLKEALDLVSSFLVVNARVWLDTKRTRRKEKATRIVI